MSTTDFDALIDAAAAPYRAHSRFAWHFARGKLRHDPLFAGLLRLGLFQSPLRILDVGCGQALLANWLAAAAHQRSSAWPAVSPFAAYRGIDLVSADIQRANRALPDSAQVACVDMRTAPFETADRIMMLDVLHYVDAPAQDALIARARAALSDDGRLVLRVGDARAGWRFWQTWLTDQAILMTRGQPPVRLCFRALPEWLAALEAAGFRVEATPMSTGTPFANTLLVARPAHDSGGDADVLC